MTQNLTETLYRVFLSGILLAFALGLNYLHAWTAPTQAPTGGNVAAPLNTGGTLQGKSGGLQMGSLDIIGTNGASVVSGQLSFWDTSTIVNPSYTIDMDALDPGANNGIRFPDGSVQTVAASSAGTVLAAGTILGGSSVTIAPGFNVVQVEGAYSDSDSSVISGFVTNQAGVWKGFAVVAGSRMNGVTLTTTESCTNTTNTLNNLCYRKDASGNLIVRPGSSVSAPAIHYVAH